MENNKETSEFRYTYSAKEQAELRRIRDKYTARPEEDKMERLRRLDAGVTQRAQALSLVFGIIGVLLLGLGMSLIMSDFGAPLGGAAIPIGILAGVLGGVLAGVAYPIYHLVLARERKRVAPEILRLTEELMR